MFLACNLVGANRGEQDLARDPKVFRSWLGQSKSRFQRERSRSASGTYCVSPPAVGRNALDRGSRSRLPSGTSRGNHTCFWLVTWSERIAASRTWPEIQRFFRSWLGQSKSRFQRERSRSASGTYCVSPPAVGRNALDRGSRSRLPSGTSRGNHACFWLVARSERIAGYRTWSAIQACFWERGLVGAHHAVSVKGPARQAGPTACLRQQ